MIISLELEPGEVINESDLQRRLKLGRTPIREALQRLAREKLVNIVPRRGMFVTEISITDLQRLFEVRMEMEALAARLAAARSLPYHWRKMEAILGGLQALQGSDLNAELIRLDEAFHRQIYAAADNELLEDALQEWYTLSLRLWHFSLSDVGDMHDALQQHFAILEAIRNRDASEASTLLRGHIRAFQNRIQQAMLAESPEAAGAQTETEASNI